MELTKKLKLAMCNCCKKSPFMVAYNRQGTALTNLYVPQFLPSGIAIGKRIGKSKVNLRKGMILYEQT